MKNLKLLVLAVLVLFISEEAFSQKFTECKASEMNKKMINKSKKAKAEYLQFENYTKEFISSGKALKSRQATYTIPVVVHVFGTDFSGTSVTQSTIERAISELNREFNGQNSDYNTVDSRFRSIRGRLNIEFKLAKIGPNGNRTTGVEFHGARSGFGNDDTYDSQIRSFAWDNYKYMNVYIQSDLYNDGDYYNSGVAWYPHTGMSNNNTARVVYNGRYLFGNTNNEFASVFTHEFGHWLNLIHTHEGGCSGTDQVSDTPQDTRDNDGNCSETSDCGAYINYENYMGYNGAAGCYKMYTQGQVSRMLAALEHPARRPLWQRSNLVATGVVDGGGGNVPQTPTGLRESNVATTSFTGSWGRVSSATSYEVQLLVGGRWETQGNTAQTSYSFRGLPTNSTQRWRVRATNSEGSSSYSSERTVQLSGDGGNNTLPVPTGIRSDNFSSGFFIVWSLVSGASQYDIQLRRNGSWSTVGTSNTYYYWVAREGSVSSYEYRLRARNGSDTSDWSRSYTANLSRRGNSGIGASLSIFPNAVKRGNDISIQYVPETDAPVSVIIYNINGVMMKRFNMSSKTNIVSYNTSNLVNGIYYVKIHDGSSSKVKRLIIH
jgi:hypothetical protein